MMAGCGVVACRAAWPKLTSASSNASHNAEFTLCHAYANESNFSSDSELLGLLMNSSAGAVKPISTPDQKASRALCDTFRVLRIDIIVLRIWKTPILINTYISRTPRQPPNHDTRFR